MITFIYGGLPYYESIMRSAIDNNIDVNWVPPLHLNVGFPDNSPYSTQSRRNIDFNFAKKMGINIKTEDWVKKNSKGVFVLCEGVKRELINKKEDNKIISLTVMTDFRSLYKKYIGYVDHVVCPSESFMKYYHSKGNPLLSSKNLYFGSTKYDVKANKETVRKKYNINTKKPIACVLTPKVRDMNSVKLDKVLSILRSEGYYIITKTRIKDPTPDKFLGDKHFKASLYYPYTSLELFSMSDVVVNFDSTAIKETIMLEKPTINFAVKKHVKPLYFLYDNICSVNLEEHNYDKFKNFISTIRGVNLTDNFKSIKDKHLFSGNVGEKVVSFLKE